MNTESEKAFRGVQCGASACGIRAGLADSAPSIFWHPDIEKTGAPTTVDAPSTKHLKIGISSVLEGGFPVY
jgi:hypothetical protein